MMRLVVLLAITITPAALAQTEVVDSPWFPAQEGTTWTYRLPDRKVTVKATKHEKQAGAMCARFETLDEKNEIVAVQHVAIGDKDARRVAHNGEKIEPPLVLLKLPTAKGQSWDVDCKMTTRAGVDTIQGKLTTDEEDVKVPAGEYKKAVRVTAELTIDGQKTTITSWYAEKVGLVKQRIATPVRSYEMELIKLELPK